MKIIVNYNNKLYVVNAVKKEIGPLLENAPELYEACKEAYHILNYSGCQRARLGHMLENARRQLQHGLAKAEGKEAEK